MPMYSPISTRLKALAVVQDTVAASKRPLSQMQMITIVDAVTEDLESGTVNSVADETRLAASLASAVQAIQDEKNSAIQRAKRGIDRLHGAEQLSWGQGRSGWASQLQRSPWQRGQATWKSGAEVSAPAILFPVEFEADNGPDEPAHGVTTVEVHHTSNTRTSTDRPGAITPSVARIGRYIGVVWSALNRQA